MTKKLYENNAYCRSFTAIVEACEAMDGAYGVVLNETAFFPEGGGQAADKGTINGIPVVDVRQQDGRILHMLEAELKVGEEVSCEIDWELRYARMQGHTGEHILSGVVNFLYGYDNVGFHMSESTMLVDFNGSLSAEDIRKIELRANEAVYQNADIRAYYPTKEELEALQFRSKKEFDTDVRIVSIGDDIDCCACCAPHVSKTGEVGIIKILDFYAYKKGTRIEMAAGRHALLDYMSLNTSVKELMKMLSAPRDGVVDAVCEKNTSYQALRNEYQKISKRLALHELVLIEVGDSAYAFAENLTFDDLRYCANQLTESKYSTCILVSAKEEGGCNYVVSSKDKDVRPIVKEMNDTFSGKGGGQSSYAQGKLEIFSQENIKQFAERILKSEM